MKTIIAATLVLFSISTSAPAFEVPSMDGLNVQQLMQGKGKRSQRSQQGEEGQQGQQQSRQGGTQDQIKGLMNGDTSGLQGMMGSLGR
jgi:hypothetical protein